MLIWLSDRLFSYTLLGPCWAPASLIFPQWFNLNHSNFSVMYFFFVLSAIFGRYATWLFGDNVFVSGVFHCWFGLGSCYEFDFARCDVWLALWIYLVIISEWVSCLILKCSYGCVSTCVLMDGGWGLLLAFGPFLFLFGWKWNSLHVFLLDAFWKLNTEFVSGYFCYIFKSFLWFYMIL